MNFTTDISLLVPYDTDDPQRIRVWEYIKQKYALEFPNFEVIEGKCQGEWCRPEAIIDAFTKSSGEYLVIGEPDAWSYDLHNALRAVVEGPRHWSWSVGHWSKYRLTELATDSVLRVSTSLSDAITVDDNLIEQPYYLVPGNTGMVMRRSTFLECPPDTQFKGWGSEDQAWGMALRYLLGPEWRRTNAPLVHLWHPKEGRNDYGEWKQSASQASLMRFKRYQDAYLDSDFTSMNALIKGNKDKMIQSIEGLA